MDEEVTIIDSNTKNEKIKNFFNKNKKKLIIVFAIQTKTLYRDFVTH